MHIIKSFSLRTIYQRFLKNHNALDVNNRSNFDILHRHTVDSNGKLSLQVVRNSDFVYPKIILPVELWLNLEVEYINVCLINLCVKKKNRICFGILDIQCHVVDFLMNKEVAVKVGTRAKFKILKMYDIYFILHTFYQTDFFLIF